MITVIATIAVLQTTPTIAVIIMTTITEMRWTLFYMYLNDCSHCSDHMETGSWKDCSTFSVAIAMIAVIVVMETSLEIDCRGLSQQSLSQWSL